jgi:hypothetical protein
MGDPMPTHLDEICSQTEKLVSRGAASDELIVYLHGAGLSIVESIRVLCQALRVSTGEAKRLVIEHPVWRDEVRANEPLHDALEARLGEIASRRGG